MKLIESTPSKQFKPFRLTLEIESEEEARLLWHVFNNASLRACVFDNYRSSDTIKKYNKNIDSNFSFDSRDAVCVAISKEVTIEN